MKEPKVEVGILFEPQIEFILLTPYHVSGKEVNGKQTVTYDEGKILWNGRQYDELVFEPPARIRCIIRVTGCDYRDKLPLGTQRRPTLPGFFKDYRRKRQADWYQCHPRGRLPDQRHLQRDECYRFSGTAEGTCSHLTQLAACKPFRFAN